jgi:transposase
VNRTSGQSLAFERRRRHAEIEQRADLDVATLMSAADETCAWEDMTLAEVDADMSRFPSAAHVMSWAWLCTRMDESAGKRRSTRLRKGALWLKPVLVQCAWGAARTKRTYTQAQFLRLEARRGPMKAVVAVAARILTAAYYILRDGVSYHKLGPDQFVQRDRTRVAERLARRIRELGYEVTIQQAA